MDAAGYLKRQGWRGDGHSLDHTGRGIRKPLLVSKKVDVLGIGLNKHAAVSDQWWMRAFDQGLKDLGTGKRSALADVREKGMAYGGLYGRFVQGEGVAGTFDEEMEGKSSRKRKREEDLQKPGNTEKKVKTNTEALEKALNRDVRTFVSEAVRRGLIHSDDEKPAAKSGSSDTASKFGEEAVVKVFTKAGLLGEGKSKASDHQDKYGRGKLQRAVKRAAKNFLVGQLSVDEQKALSKDEPRSKEKPKPKSQEEPSERDDKTAAREAKALRKRERKEKKSTKQTDFEFNADEVKFTTSAKAKSKTIPGVGAVDRYPTKAEKRAKKQQARKDKENTTPEHTPSEDTSNVGCVADTKGDAGLEGRSSSSDSMSVIDTVGNIRYTCKPGKAVPLDPTIWTGIKPKLLPKPVRKARSEYMSERREARQARKAKKLKS
ncbi:hypothetical protein M409DRAFT_20338 [Zasmidium cellare ATCC 36951]|uniref:G-patch domain-containing protein n=1 Tax=Zasmidium cellare ATCC 36951 TaxID=1080233 RepID=A0A6A6CSH8_ZASCE|nr:uncharacterized protein M409DRAFT_20338 [Zasmidium cellare ATCC 36951]KAF2169110.1 hypothetical protein M409DRAFT_20338 [Zasmidium cellare ATCC 36951]